MRVLAKTCWTSIWNKGDLGSQKVVGKEEDHRLHRNNLDHDARMMMKQSMMKDHLHDGKEEEGRKPMIMRRTMIGQLEEEYSSHDARVPVRRI